MIAVIGTATVKAGDPSGHSKDRKRLQEKLILKNAKKIANCIQRIFDNYAENLYDNRLTKNLSPLKILYNHEWYENLSAIDFVSSICRKFRVGPMMGR